MIGSSLHTSSIAFWTRFKLYTLFSNNYKLAQAYLPTLFIAASFAFIHPIQLSTGLSHGEYAEMNSVEIPRHFNHFKDSTLLWIVALSQHTTNSLLESLLLMCAFLRLITNRMKDFSLKRFVCTIYFIVPSLWECGHYAHAEIVRIFASHCFLSFWWPPVGLETPTWNWELIQKNNFMFQFQ